MREFQVGETAIGCNYLTLPDRNGMVCMIIAPLRLVEAFEVGRSTYTTKPRYLVHWADGLESFCQPHTLRPRRASDRVFDERRKVATHEADECIAQAVQSVQGGVYA